MSKFKDIKIAYDAYKIGGSWTNVNSGLIYTCNGGWIDLGHLNPNNKRATIGAANLWKQFTEEGPKLTRPECQLTLGSSGYALLRYALSGCRHQSEFRFQDGKTGYKVVFRMDHGNYTFKQRRLPSVEHSYIVKHGLDLHQKKSVALTIFMNVSKEFEGKQRFYGGFDWFTDSGFSQEDLVSNLIGFYIGLGLYTKNDAITRLHPVSQSMSEYLWKTNGAVGDHENHTFEPDFIDTTNKDGKNKDIKDECALQPKKLPAIFSAIIPATAGVNFLRL